MPVWTKFRATGCALNPEPGDWLCWFLSFLTKFRAESCALNPKLGDWEDIYNLKRVKTGINLKGCEVCVTYGYVVVGVVPRGVKFFDRAPQPAKVLPGAPGAGRINYRQLVLPQAQRRWGQIRSIPLFSVIGEVAQVGSAAGELGDPAQLSRCHLSGHKGGAAGV